MRRCGKSTLLRLFSEELQAGGVPIQNIITINLEQLENERLLDYRVLYDEIVARLVPKRMNYVFLELLRRMPPCRASAPPHPTSSRGPPLQPFPAHNSPRLPFRPFPSSQRIKNNDDCVKDATPPPCLWQDGTLHSHTYPHTTTHTANEKNGSVMRAHKECHINGTLSHLLALETQMRAEKRAR